VERIDDALFEVG